MAQRDYSIKPLSVAEKKRLSKAERKYPGGSSIPVNLPTNYRQAKTENKKCAGSKFFKEGNCSN